jgi:hypothetical protein
MDSKTLAKATGYKVSKSSYKDCFVFKKKKPLDQYGNGNASADYSFFLEVGNKLYGLNIRATTLDYGFKNGSWWVLAKVFEG